MPSFYRTTSVHKLCDHCHVNPLPIPRSVRTHTCDSCKANKEKARKRRNYHERYKFARLGEVGFSVRRIQLRLKPKATLFHITATKYANFGDGIKKKITVVFSSYNELEAQQKLYDLNQLRLKTSPGDNSIVFKLKREVFK